MKMTMKLQYCPTSFVRCLVEEQHRLQEDAAEEVRMRDLALWVAEAVCWSVLQLEEAGDFQNRWENCLSRYSRRQKNQQIQRPRQHLGRQHEPIRWTRESTASRFCCSS